MVDRDGCHKWLGCISSGNNRGSHRLDLEYRLQAASKTFFANKNIFCNKAVSFVKRLQFFHQIVTPVACFAAGHRKIYKTDLETIDVHFPRLLRSVVGPPSQTNWLNPWHEILHDWNAPVAYNNISICVPTLLVYLMLDGYQELWLGGPGILENVGPHSGCGSPPRKPSAVGKV